MSKCLDAKRARLVIFLFFLSSLLVVNVKGDPLPTPRLQEGGSDNDYGYSVVKTTDGGYAFAGYTTSSGVGGADFLLVKTDANGNLQWSVTYGGEGEEIAYSVIQSSENYLVVGTTTSWGEGKKDCLLVKVDKSGKVVDNRTYGGTGNDIIYEIIQDGPFYALVGWTDDIARVWGGNDFWFLKLHSSFEVELDRTYGGAGNDVAESIVAIGSGNYVIAGYSSSYGNKDDLWCIQIDSAGAKTKELIYGGPGNDEGRSIIATSDGYAIAGFKDYDVNNAWDFWLVKVDLNLNFEFERIFGEPTQQEGAWSIIKMSDGGYVLAGYAYSNSQYDIMLVKTDANGNLAWLNNYDGSGNEGAECAIKDDSGIVVAGYTNSYGKGNDFLLLETSQNGDSQWSATYGEVQYNLTVNIVGNGVVNKAPGGPYNLGDVVQLTAVPHSGWNFSAWSGDLVSTTNPDSIAMTGSITVTATFTESENQLILFLKNYWYYIVFGVASVVSITVIIGFRKKIVGFLRGKSPPPDGTEKLKLDRNTKARIIALLCLKQFSDEARRRALINLAFQGCDSLLNQIDISGAPWTFAANLIPLLTDYGKIKQTGKQALVALLEAMSSQVGVTQQEEISRIIQSLNEVGQ